MTMDDKRKKYIDVISKYELKEPVAGKCVWKYFLNGFLSPFKPIHQKYCPHCCEKITDKEYFEFLGAFSVGCANCRTEVKNNP